MITSSCAFFCFVLDNVLVPLYLKSSSTQYGEFVAGGCWPPSCASPSTQHSSSHCHEKVEEMGNFSEYTALIRKKAHTYEKKICTFGG